METGDRRGLMMMGPKSEAFARQTLRVLEQNPKIVPASLDLVCLSRLKQARRSRLDRRLTCLQQVGRPNALDAQLDHDVLGNAAKADAGQAGHGARGQR